MSFSTTYNSFRKIKLIRYLIAWRVNSSLVSLPECFSVELSRVLGTIISNRLPTREAGRWQKTLSALNEYCDAPLKKGRRLAEAKVLPNAPWPVDAVFFIPPGKSTYGLGELVFWELKLFGDAADHGFFLETILPAMEEAGYSSDGRWNRPNRIWGRFDIHAVYAARGARWEPLVSEGRLDLRLQASASQWAEGWTFGAASQNAFRQVVWLTPFELEGAAEDKERSPSDSGESVSNARSFTLKAILEALVSRLNPSAPAKRRAVEGLRDIFDEEGRLGLQEVFELALQTPLLFKDLEAAAINCPGRWRGRHVFAPLPKEIIPYLELASLLHVGKHTHFGCGTFSLA